MSAPLTVPLGANWAVFDRFRRPIAEQSVSAVKSLSTVRSWSSVMAWSAAIEARLGPRREALTRLRIRSDQALAVLGGDPSVRDWVRFRPIRRDREEDWSDWLAQLIGDSTTGRFACSLLGKLEERVLPTDYATPEVRREWPHEASRADLIIGWQDGTYTHLEVKVGDPNLRKMLKTSEAMEHYFHGTLQRRSDVILLLPSQADAWAVACEQEPGLCVRGVRKLTWLDLARALREALLSVDEPISWRVWAHAFCGVIQQELLGLQFRPTAEEWVRALTPNGLETAAILLGDE